MFIIPPNYTVHDARDQSDRWSVYKLLILKREPEPFNFNLGVALLNPIILLPLILLNLILLLYILPSQDQGWFFVIRLTVLQFLFSCILLQLVSLFEFFSTYRNRVAIALYRGQICGSAKIAFRERYSVIVVYVAPGHRRRGLGSHLVQHFLQREVLPIYINTKPELMSFYTRLGFVATSQQKGYNMVVRVLE